MAEVTIPESDLRLKSKRTLPSLLKGAALQIRKAFQKRITENNHKPPDSPTSHQQASIVEAPSIPLPIEGRRSEHIVADAMLYGQAMLLKDALVDGKNLKETPKEDKRAFIEKVTDEKCGEASAHAVEYLDRYPNDFDVLLILNGQRATSNGSAEFNDGPFDHHYRFLAREKTTDDNEPVWFSGSPANYKREQNPAVGNSPITRINQSTDLSLLLEEIKTQDGGIWPTAEQINAAITATEFRNPYNTVTAGAKEFVVRNITPEKTFNKTMLLRYLPSDSTSY